ncbi:MAG: hypothetical protein ACLTTH_00045 [Holdemanella porci]
MWTYTTDSMDFVTVSTGLILPYWMGLPIRYIHMSVKRLGNKKYEIRGSVPTSTGKYHRYSFRKTFNSINDAREFELKYKRIF